jgi:hypothetical protein
MENASRNLCPNRRQAQERCAHDDEGLELGQTCRWRLKEVKETHACRTSDDSVTLKSVSNRSHMPCSAPALYRTGTSFLYSRALVDTVCFFFRILRPPSILPTTSHLTIKLQYKMQMTCVFKSAPE